jgi:hypothetical protein
MILKQGFPHHNILTHTQPKVKATMDYVIDFLLWNTASWHVNNMGFLFFIFCFLMLNVWEPLLLYFSLFDEERDVELVPEETYCLFKADVNVYKNRNQYVFSLTCSPSISRIPNSSCNKQCNIHHYGCIKLLAFSFSALLKWMHTFVFISLT